MRSAFEVLVGRLDGLKASARQRGLGLFQRLFDALGIALGQLLAVLAQQLLGLIHAVVELIARLNFRQFALVVFGMRFGVGAHLLGLVL